MNKNDHEKLEAKNGKEICSFTAATNQQPLNSTRSNYRTIDTKHMEVDRYFIKEKMDGGLICRSYVPSQQQLADILTKGLIEQSNIHTDLQNKYVFTATATSRYSQKRGLSNPKALFTLYWGKPSIEAFSSSDFLYTVFLYKKGNQRN